MPFLKTSWLMFMLKFTFGDGELLFQGFILLYVVATFSLCFFPVDISHMSSFVHKEGRGFLFFFFLPLGNTHNCLLSFVSIHTEFVDLAVNMKVAYMGADLQKTVISLSLCPFISLSF